MSNDCLAVLAKSRSIFIDFNFFIKFLASWYGFDKHCTEILTYLNITALFTLVNQKAALKAAQASKKIKFIDDLIIAKAARITALRD